MNWQYLFGKKLRNPALLLLLVFLAGHTITYWNSSGYEIRVKESKVSISQLAENAVSLPVQTEGVYKLLEPFEFTGFTLAAVILAVSELRVTRFVSPSERNVFYYLTTINAP